MWQTWHLKHWSSTVAGSWTKIRSKRIKKDPTWGNTHFTQIRMSKNVYYCNTFLAVPNEHQNLYANVEIFDLLTLCVLLVIKDDITRLNNILSSSDLCSFGVCLISLLVVARVYLDKKDLYQVCNICSVECRKDLLGFWASFLFHDFFYSH